MTISAAGTGVPPIVIATKADAPAGAGDTAPADPTELVGKGRTFDRVVGGAAGFGVGVGALMGITALTEKSTVAPIKYAGAVLGVGALVAGPYLGQKLAGHLTRSTRAEAERERAAERADIDLKHRIDVAGVTGNLSHETVERAHRLREDRREVAEGHPDQNWVAKWALPALVGVGAAATAGFLAHKFSYDDGKGINQLFNMMFAIPAGGIGGAMLGSSIGNIAMPGTRHVELPARNAERIAELDREIDELIGAA